MHHAVCARASMGLWENFALGIVCRTPASCVQWSREATDLKFHNCKIVAAARHTVDTSEGAPDFFRGTVISLT